MVRRGNLAATSRALASPWRLAWVLLTATSSDHGCVQFMKIVVVGHGMVGHCLLQALAQSALEQAQVTVLCEEPRAAYDRVHLSDYFCGKSAAELSLVEPGFFERSGFDLRLKTKAVAVERRSNRVTTADGEALHYDKLVLATGSYPFVPPIPGAARGRRRRAARRP